MATPAEKLANSLERLHALQDQGVIAIRSGDLSRVHRERLIKNGFLMEVIKGWYIPNRPDEAAGESTAWYASYWDFCAAYLDHLKGSEWCLSPEQSLSLHAENWTVPRQLLVRAIKARNNVTNLPYETSLLDIRAPLPKEKDIVPKNGMRLLSLPAALVACAPGFYTSNPTEMRAVLMMVKDSSEVLDRLLEGGHSTIAGRLAGAFRNIGQDRIADDIVNTMRKADYVVNETDPFEKVLPIAGGAREQSAYVHRIRLMWQEMREVIIESFPASTGIPNDTETYLKRVEEIYVTDAYHSLSIEGYRVSRKLIEKVRSGIWNPDSNADDLVHRNALAARGYWQAFQSVKESIGQIFKGENPGEVADDGHRNWYQELFAPSVTAGILKAGDLAGYRNNNIYIRRSKHVPPGCEAMRDAMPVLFDLLREETEASVRVVLGHFIFVYIHPYPDGNGRVGRFLMNVMLASGGYPWTVIPVEKRNEYMAALEEASVNQNIAPFAEFVARLVEK